MSSHFGYDRHGGGQYPPLQQSFDAARFEASLNGGNGLPDMSFASASTTANFGTSEPQQFFPVRERSHSSLTGSPASNYAASVSDGRNSVGYGQPLFKVPEAISHDRRYSSPIVPPQLNNNNNPLNTTTNSTNSNINNSSTIQSMTPKFSYMMRPTAQNEMHASHWTPNFSFGDPNAPVSNTNPVYADHAYAAPNMRQSGMVERRRGSHHGLQSSPHPYKVDRRMSQPLIASNSVAPLDATRQRQHSLMDWNTFAELHKDTASTPNTSLDYSMPAMPPRGFALNHDMNVLSLQNEGPSESGPQDVGRRYSVQSIPEHAAFGDTPRMDMTNGATVDTRRFRSFDSSSGSSDDSNVMPFLNSQSFLGAPNQASMMNTFSAKDSDGKHRKHGCETCGKRFTRPSSLQTHMYSHTGAQPFACDFPGCGRPFSVVSNLRRHSKTHARTASKTVEANPITNPTQPIS